MVNDPLPNVYDLMAQTGPFRCGGGCGAMVSHPMGSCETCSLRYEAEQMRALLSPARQSVPERFRWADLSTRETCAEIAERENQKGTTRIGWRSVNAVRRIPKPLPTGVALVGCSGAGKTTLACALLRQVHDWAQPGRSHEGVERARRAFFVEAIELERYGKAVDFGRKTDGPNLLLRAERASVLVLDNVEAGSVDGAVGRVIFARHNRSDARNPKAPRLVTIITTHMTEAEMAQSFGAGVARRAFECTVELQPEAVR